MSYGCEARGRVTSVSQGLGAMGRTTTYHYDEGAMPRAQPSSIDDALTRTVVLDYDALNRPTGATGAVRSLIYDDVARGFSTAPPDADAHVFSLDDHGLVSRHDPPAVMSGPTPSVYTRDDDGLGTDYDSGDVHVLTHRDPMSARQRTEADDEGRSSRRSVPGDVTLGCASASLGRIARGQQRGPWTSHPTVQPQLSRGGDVRPTGGCVPAARQARAYDAPGRLPSFTVDATAAIAVTRDRDGLLMTAGPLTFTREATSGLSMPLSVGAVSTSEGLGFFREAPSTLGIHSGKFQKPKVA